MPDIAREVTVCRICGGGLKLVLDMGDQALGCRYPKAGEEAPRAPLVLMRCEKCGLLQLSHSVVTAEMYRTDYGYRSGINATMRAHLAGVVKAAHDLARGVTADGSAVLDIGSNDGTLLNCWGVMVLPGLKIGIDPSAPESYEHAIAIQDYFSAEAYFNATLKKAKAVTSIAMLYDLDDPVWFAKEVAEVLHSDGVWVIEVMYAGAMLDGAFDQISHEHVTHLGLRDIKDIVERAGLRVFDANLNDMNGGTLRVMVCHKDGPHSAHLRPIGSINAGILNAEAAWDDAYCAAFADKARRTATALHDLIGDLNAAGRTVDILGASQKGNTLLQFAGLDNAYIRRAVERDDAKVGLFTPGTDIPIVSEKDAADSWPDYYLVLPWHFRDEIVEREAAFIDAGGHMIFPLPRIEII